MCSVNEAQRKDERECASEREMHSVDFFVAFADFLRRCSERTLSSSMFTSIICCKAPRTPLIRRHAHSRTCRIFLFCSFVRPLACFYDPRTACATALMLSSRALARLRLHFGCRVAVASRFLYYFRAVLFFSSPADLTRSSGWCWCSSSAAFCSLGVAVAVATRLASRRSAVCSLHMPVCSLSTLARCRARVLPPGSAAAKAQKATFACVYSTATCVVLRTLF